MRWISGLHAGARQRWLTGPLCLTIIIALGYGSGCAAPAQPPAAKPKSVSALLAEATRCDKEAAQHESMIRHDAESRRIEDHCANPIDDVSTTGGERLVQRRPCWSGIASADQRHRQRADELRREAGQYRVQAKELLAMEESTCAGLPQDDIDYSPFFHHDDIVGSEPYYENGSQLRGATVWFRKVPGLTLEWMHRAVQCHQARAAVMGYSDSFQPYCPLSLDQVTVALSETDHHIVLVIRAPDQDTALAVWGRVQDACDSAPPVDTESPAQASTIGPTP